MVKDVSFAGKASFGLASRSMSNNKLFPRIDAGHRFCFEAYGVKINVESNDPELLGVARREVQKAFAGIAAILDNNGFDAIHSFSLLLDHGGRWTLHQDGEYVATAEPGRWFLSLFNGRLRCVVVDYAEAKVFLHAGVVGWRGKAIVVPGISMQGKTTLIAELVRCGATYYSDEYAVLDEAGRVHPFPRVLSFRRPGEIIQERDVAPEELGGEIGSEPIEIGMVLFTEFQENTVWQPRELTTGEGVLETIPRTFVFRANPDFALRVLSAAMQHARIFKGPRGEASNSAPLMLNSLWQS